MALIMARKERKKTEKKNEKSKRAMKRSKKGFDDPGNRSCKTSNRTRKTKRKSKTRFLLNSKKANTEERRVLKTC